MTIRDRLRRLIPMSVRQARHQWRDRILDNERHSELVGRRNFLRSASKAIAFNGITGDYAEFGCCGGGTFGMAYQALRARDLAAKLWAFDSFAGFPPQSFPEDEHPVWVAGGMAFSLSDFHAVCRSKGMRLDRDYKIVQGYYGDSLADDRLERADRPRDIALAYIDCDLYSSTMDVLRFLRPRFKHGMIFAFDDYYCWSANQVSGERNACNEIFAVNGQFRLVPYIQFGWHGMSFVLEEKQRLKGADVHY